jgi:hypothetical protein
MVTCYEERRNKIKPSEPNKTKMNDVTTRFIRDFTLVLSLGDQDRHVAGNTAAEKLEY